MEKCGVCSVSFRDHTADEIIEATKAAGLDGIEWGSDVHVRSDAPEEARRISARMKEYGLVNLSYGTYFGVDGFSMESWEAYQETAKELGTDTVRIWPPDKAVKEMTPEEYSRRVQFMQAVADRAAQNGITVCFESHRGTLTEDAQDAIRYIKDIDRENVRMYWQPNQDRTPEENLAAAKALSRYVKNVHVFHWKGEERFPLTQGIGEWKRYKEALDAEAEGAHSCLLEFMHDGRLESLAGAAAALQRIVAREAAVKG